jgi:chromosome segregation ATPase
MGMKILVGLIFLLVTGLMYLNISSAQREKHLSEELTQVRAQLAQEKSREENLSKKETLLEQKLQQDESQLHSQQQQSADDLKSLRNKVSFERSRLEIMLQRVQELKASLKKGGGNLQNQIQMDQKRLQDLERAQGSAQTAEKDVDRQRAAVLKNQKAEVNGIAEDLKNKIRLQEATLKSDAEELRFWHKQNKNINQLTKIAEIEQKQSDDREVLRALQAQRGDLSQEEKRQSKNVQVMAQNEKADIQDSRGQVQEQIKQVREDLKKLQSQADQNKKGDDDLKSRLQQAEQEYNFEYSKFTGLQEALKAKEASVPKH